MRPYLLAAGLLALTTVPAAAVDKKAVNRAIERGVAALKAAQGEDGTWPSTEIGSTALAALTLLECGVEKKDPAVVKAADKVREAAFTMKETYSISLAILFLDRLDESTDTPLIESLIVRLLAGQVASGGWSYNCPTIGEDEIKRIRAEMAGNANRVLRAGVRDLKKLPAKNKRKQSDLPQEIQDQLKAIAKLQAAGGGGGDAGVPGLAATPDNSNTQFATLAMWVGRRYGVPTQAGLVKLYEYFRRSQHADGGWGYMFTPGVGAGGVGSTAPMTCAGLLGLAVGHGAALDLKKAKGEKVEKQDVSKDQSLKIGLVALSTAIGVPLGWQGDGLPPAGLPAARGKSFYFLWSLERVAVVLNLKTIGKKDWYAWGAEVLIGNQENSGLWTRGEYGGRHGHADTCFALLFLKRSNLAEDLSSAITGLTDPGERRLKAGGVGGAGLRGGTAPAALSGLDQKGEGAAKRPRPKEDTPERKAAMKLIDDLPKARGEARAGILKKLKDSNGVAYTEALLYGISELDTEARRDARAALAQRFTRLRATTLREYTKDKDMEVRRAAALAIGSKELKELSPELIKLLDDAEGVVARAAQEALKHLSGRDYGPKANATPAERKKAVEAWQTWWKAQVRE